MHSLELKQGCALLNGEEIDMNDRKTYLSKIEEDDSQGLIVSFPEELIKALDWKPGDLLVWAQLDTTGFVVSKFEPEAFTEEATDGK